MDFLKGKCPGCGKPTTVRFEAYDNSGNRGRVFTAVESGKVERPNSAMADGLVPTAFRERPGFLPGFHDGVFLTMQHPTCCLDSRTLLFVVKNEHFLGFRFD